MKTAEQKAMEYLKTQFEDIENVIDINNKSYTAKVSFFKEDKPVKHLFSQEAKIGDAVLTYRSFSPTNHNGKLKEGYYIVSYHIQPKPAARLHK